MKIEKVRELGEEELRDTRSPISTEEIFRAPASRRRPGQLDQMAGKVREPAARISPEGEDRPAARSRSPDELVVRPRAKPSPGNLHERRND